MPIRKRPGEKKDEFVSRCISEEVGKGMKQDQAAAVCYTYWEYKQLSAVKNIRRKNRKFKKELEQFEKTRVYVDSSNVERVMYDDETKEMTIRFNDGSTYTYFDVDMTLFEDIIDGEGTCKTRGANKWGEWWVGKSPSIGAAVYERLVERKVKYKKGGDFR